MRLSLVNPGELFMIKIEFADGVICHTVYKKGAYVPGERKFECALMKYEFIVNKIILHEQIFNGTQLAHFVPDADVYVSRQGVIDPRGVDPKKLITRNIGNTNAVLRRKKDF